jgi:hypothetical protein
MVARSKSSSDAFQWTALIYFLVVLAFPLVLVSTVQAQGSSAPYASREDLGDGKPAEIICGTWDPADVGPVIGIDLGMFGRITK